LKNGNSWYQLTPEQVFQTLRTNHSGLASSEAKARLEEYGYNELKTKKRSPFVRFLLQFNNALLYVLMVAAVIAALLGKFMDMWVIIGVVIATVVIGFIQEGKAESSLEGLKKMMTPECMVRRDGKQKTIATRELVPGDIVLVESGDRVPADLRLISVKGLNLDEAALTGESLPVLKDIDSIPRPNLSPGQQNCMCFSGTFITRGRGQGVVIATAKQTEIGKIAGMMEETKKAAPPITKKIAAFTKFIIFATVLFGIMNFILGTALGYDAGYMLLATAGMIVAMIPEGLAGAIIAAFAVGAIAMARRNALIRRLPAAETLGCTTVICSDKTGTLTKNEMTVTRIYCGGKVCHVSGVGYAPSGEFRIEDKKIDPLQESKELMDMLRVGYLCNDSILVEDNGGFNIKGSPTAGAMVVLAAKAGIDEKLPRLDEIPFESEQKYMATLHEGDTENLISVKGSPERILEMCASQMIEGVVSPLDAKHVHGKVEEMASGALRVLGIAYKYVGKDKTSLAPEDLKGMVFLGLQGMIDPPKPEAIEAIKKCKTAGIRTVMITGDHVETAKAIARELGIGGVDEGGALTGEELQAMSNEELYEVVDKVSVYARVSPEHKFRIVKQLQKRGHVVAVTGDGVNDAPALKAADIGVAMGITGTEVSKEAADMVLIDDNFATIVAAVEEGRHVFTNIWKVILYLLPTNGGQGLVMIGAILLSPLIPVLALRLPIEPVQILWVNLIMAIGCSIPLIWEPKEKGILERPPRDPNEKLFNPLFLQKVGIVSLVSAAAAFSLFIIYTNTMAGSEDYLTQAQTVAFTTLIMVQLGYLFTARSIRESAFTFSPFSNKWVLVGAAATFGLQLLIVYSYPLFGFSPFRTLPFPPQWWIYIGLVSLLGFLAIEGEKLLRRRFGKTSL